MFAAAFQQLGDTRHCLARSLTACRRYFIRNVEVRERPALLRTGRRPVKPVGPHVEHLLADAAFGRQVVQGRGSHLRFEFHVELVEQFGFCLEVGEQ